MQIDVKNNNTNVLEYEFTIGDFIKDFFIQEKTNNFKCEDYSIFIPSSYGTNPSNNDYVPDRFQFFNSDKWVSTFAIATVNGDSDTQMAERISAVWIYLMPILKIQKNVDDLDKYKYITIDTNFNYSFGKSTFTYMPTIETNNTMYSNIDYFAINVSNTDNIVSNGTKEYIMYNSFLRNATNKIQSPHNTTQVIPYATRAFSMMFNNFTSPTNLLKDNFTFDNKKSHLLPSKVRKCNDLYLQLDTKLNSFFIYLLSRKMTALTFPKNFAPYNMPWADTSTINPIYDSEINTISSNGNIYTYNNENAQYPTLCRASKVFYENYVEIENKKVMIYLSKEPIY